MAYDRVHLSEFFSGKSADDLSLVTPGFYEENNISVHLNDKALSINPKSKTVDAVFAEVEKHESLTIPAVLTSGENDWLRSDSYHNKVDLTVFHPVQKMIDGRPDWLRMNGYRKPFKIKNETVFIDEKTLVQAFLQDEGDNGLPVDQVLVTSAEGESTFLLPAGKYRTQSITIDGAIKKGPDFNLD